MSHYDWIVLCGTLAFIILYGMWKSRHTSTIETYFLADRQLPWYHIGLSVMATQASAITFLSGPGQGFSSGLGFVQFYFGLPLAMVLICITFIPIFHKLNVFTAYEYLEKRFDNKTRSLTAALFLIQRGLSTGITIYAPAIILSTILNIDIRITILLNGLLVIVYTVYGGTKAVSYTQMLQMGIIFSGLILAACMVIAFMPSEIGLGEALNIAGKMDKLNAIDTKFDLNNRFNIWSGIIGGFFLQLSYFGTDQSQVGRYLTGKSINQSRMGLVMNGLLKIPMQFIILLIGTMVFVFYQFKPQPLFYNKAEVSKIMNSEYADQYANIEKHYDAVNVEKTKAIYTLNAAMKSDNEQAVNEASTQLQTLKLKSEGIRKEAEDLLKTNNKEADTNDSNYVFLIFVTENLPVGIVGLLIAVIFLAGMGSTASGLSSLTSTTTVDFYKRFINKQGDEKAYMNFSRWCTVAWGLFCIVVAFYASHLGNLIVAVNILGSLFYGVILGIFMVAFFLKRVGGKAVFPAALISELLVVIVWKLEIMEFLWLNVVGCISVLILSLILHVFIKKDISKIESA
ncbi:MAG TPA: sodium:solute symporter [Bacteroidia bacterium]